MAVGTSLVLVVLYTVNSKRKREKFPLESSMKVCEVYQTYFGMPVVDQNKSWSPLYCCKHCKKTLEGLMRGEKRPRKYSNPRIWWKPTDHFTNCNFCIVDVIKQYKGNNATTVDYSHIPSSIAPIAQVNNLIKDMGLIKSNIELFISRTKQWNLVKEDCR